MRILAPPLCIVSGFLTAIFWPVDCIPGRALKSGGFLHIAGNFLIFE